MIKKCIRYHNSCPSRKAIKNELACDALTALEPVRSPTVCRITESSLREGWGCLVIYSEPYKVHGMF